MSPTSKGRKVLADGKLLPQTVAGPLYILEEGSGNNGVINSENEVSISDDAFYDNSDALYYYMVIHLFTLFKLNLITLELQGIFYQTQFQLCK